MNSSSYLNGCHFQAKHEMSMTKEQQEEAKRNYLVSVKHTIEFEKIASAELRGKIRQLHQRICKLEADKYDLEKRHERQEYDVIAFIFNVFVGKCQVNFSLHIISNKKIFTFGFNCYNHLLKLRYKLKMLTQCLK